jgi:hypothetical protein
MLIAQDVPDGSQIADCYQPLDLPSCLQLSALGFGGVVRYIDNLTLREIEWITDHGKLGLMLIRTCRKEGWKPTRLEGVADGQSIAAASSRLGLPKGVSAWIDDEGPGGVAEDEIAYLNAAYDELVRYCLPGIYVGAGTHLSSNELYHRLKMTRYWHSGSFVPDVETRSYCIRQEPPLNRVLPGMPERLFDVSTAKADNLSGRCVWAVAA